MTVVVPSGLWMMVRVGWITVPAAERYTIGWGFLVAATAEPAIATTPTTTQNAMTRIAPRFHLPVIYPAFSRHPSGLATRLCDTRFPERDNQGPATRPLSDASDIVFTAFLP